MIDGLIKGDGTSRTVKGNLPATYDEFRNAVAAGTQTLDILFNTLGWSTLPTFLNKANLLVDAAASLYGLGADAVPNDVFAWLGKYNQHWWRRRKTIGSYAPVLDLEYYIPESVSDNNYIYCGRSSRSAGSGLNTEGTVRYSDALDIDSSGRIIGLKEPVSTVTLSYNKYTNAEVLKGKYLAMKYNYPQQSTEEERGFMYVAPTATILRTSASQLGFVYSTLSAINMTTKAIPGDWEFLQSSDRSSYPDSGEQDGYEYQYLGVPFGNAVTSPKIATGSYVGTGTYGVNNPTTVSVEGVPIMAVVHGLWGRPNTITGDSAGLLVPGQVVVPINDSTNTNPVAVEVSGTTMKWYSDSSMESDQGAQQANASNRTYNYIIVYV